MREEALEGVDGAGGSFHLFFWCKWEMKVLGAEVI